jgi:hypothetical protein
MVSSRDRYPNRILPGNVPQKVSHPKRTTLERTLLLRAKEADTSKPPSIDFAEFASVGISISLDCVIFPQRSARTRQTKVEHNLGWVGKP